MYKRQGYYYAIAYVTNAVNMPMNSDLVSPALIMGPIFVFCLVYGIIIGAFGSLFSIRKMCIRDRPLRPLGILLP